VVISFVLGVSLPFFCNKVNDDDVFLSRTAIKFQVPCHIQGVFYCESNESMFAFIALYFIRVAILSISPSLSEKFEQGLLGMSLTGAAIVALISFNPRRFQSPVTIVVTLVRSMILRTDKEHPAVRQ
jgi:hypothetical protein